MATYGGLGAPLSRIKIEETARSALTVYLCNNLSKVGHICTFYIERPDFDLNIVLQINFPIHFKEWLKIIKKSLFCKWEAIGPSSKLPAQFFTFSSLSSWQSLYYIPLKSCSNLCLQVSNKICCQCSLPERDFPNLLKKFKNRKYLIWKMCVHGCLR